MLSLHILQIQLLTLGVSVSHLNSAHELQVSFIQGTLWTYSVKYVVSDSVAAASFHWLIKLMDVYITLCTLLCHSVRLSLLSVRPDTCLPAV